MEHAAKGRLRQSCRACASIFRIKLAEELQYRANALSGAAVSILYALIEIAILTVFYRCGERAGTPGIGGGMSLSQAVSYLWLGQFLCLIQFGGIDGDIVGKIDSGDVGIELCRPLDLYWHWFAKNAGGRLAPLIWRGIPILIAGALIPGSYRMQGPASPESLLAGLAAMGAAFLLNASYIMLGCVLRMNVSWGSGPTNLFLLVSQLLCGAYLPLRLWPEFLQPFLRLQPFSGLLDLPAQLYLGLIPPGELLWVGAVQAFWITTFILAGRLLLRRRMKHIVVQGG